MCLCTHVLLIKQPKSNAALKNAFFLILQKIFNHLCSCVSAFQERNFQETVKCFNHIEINHYCYGYFFFELLHGKRLVSNFLGDISFHFSLNTRALLWCIKYQYFTIINVYMPLYKYFENWHVYLLSIFVLGVVRRVFSSQGNIETEVVIKWWLRNARDRDGGRKKE